MAGSLVEIVVDSINITSLVLPASARFESQQNAIPGAFEFIVKDLDHSQQFITGTRVTLAVDGALLYGGYLLQVERTYPFPAMDTTTNDPTVIPRYWKLRGVDNNILLDKRVTRNPSDYLHQLPNFTRASYDGDLIQQMCDDYLDFDEVEASTYVDNIQPPFNLTPDGSKPGAWMQQGTKARLQIEDWTQFTGALFYIDANLYLHHHAIEDTVMRWGFSDAPNHNAITTSPATFQGATIGPREIDATESGEHMVNDAFIWGGSHLAGGGGTVFSRETNATSITAHGRWQVAEVHLGEEAYKLQEGVDVRADVIVNGPPGAVAADQNRGLRYPQWNIRFAWFAHDVPYLDGDRDHLYPGYLSTIVLETFGPEGSPLVLLMPLRTMTITFPTLDPSGFGYVRFDGMFGLQPDDPFTLWRFLLKNRAKVANIAITTVDGSSTATTFGAYGNFVPTPAPDGGETVFTIPFGYVIGTSRVYIKPVGSPGYLLLLPGVDYSESDPIAGEFTFASAPSSGESLLVNCRTLSS